MVTLNFKPGTPALTVLEAIRQESFDPEHFGSMDDYIDWLKENLLRCSDIIVSVAGESTEERAASLVSELQRNGLIAYGRV
jgi:hypothetical protein